MSVRQFIVVQDDFFSPLRKKPSSLFCSIYCEIHLLAVAQSIFTWMAGGLTALCHPDIRQEIWSSGEKSVDKVPSLATCGPRVVSGEGREMV